MEEISLKNDAQSDPRAATRLSALRAEAAKLQTEQAELSSRWEGEKAQLEAVRQMPRHHPSYNPVLTLVAPLVTRDRCAR